MTGAIFAAAFFVFQYFQLARGYSPLGTGIRLFPWLATPMVVSPIAGALSDRIGRRPVMAVGLLLQTVAFAWIALRASDAAYLELVLVLLVAGVGISMALPTVPTAVINAVEPDEMGKASGINNMMQRFGGVFAVAIASSVFAAYGSFGTAASVTDGFKPALAACAVFSLLATIAALATASPRRETLAELEPAEARIAA
jgi:MFS family permease